jgi:hypothetical protein
MEVHCQTSFCQNEDGFPKLLRACTVHLGIRSQPECDGREFIEHGTEKCVVTVYIGSSPHHVEWIRFSTVCALYFYRRIRLSTICAIFSGGFLRKPPLEIVFLEAVPYDNRM